MMRYLIKASLIGGATTFLVVPTILVAAVRLLGVGPKTPVAADLLSIYILYGLVSTVIFVLVGVPMLGLLRRIGWASWPTFAFGGVVVAIIGEALLMISGIGYWDVTNVGLLTRNTTTLAISGFCAGTIFWAIGRGSSLFSQK
jgi:hypothetical protein